MLDVVRAVEVLGVSFSTEDINAAGVASAEAGTAIGVLLGHGVFASDDDRFRFRHDLPREAVYEDIGAPVRPAMHRRIGHALAGAGAYPLTVAGHLLRGAMAGDAAAVDCPCAPPRILPPTRLPPRR